MVMDGILDDFDIVVLLLCYNEVVMIVDVVVGFKVVLFGVCIYVYDNNLIDGMVLKVVFVGVIVMCEW